MWQLDGATYTYNVENYIANFVNDYTWLNGFMRNVSRFAGKSALYDGASGQNWTYSELNQEANKLANSLLSDGVHQGDVVMFMLFNSPEFAFSYIAAHKTGAIACPVNFRLSPGEIALQIDDSQPHVFIFGEEFEETARKALAMAAHKPARIIVVGKSTQPSLNEISYGNYVAEASRDNPNISWQNTALHETTRLYTSGTTSLAKAVPLNSLNELLSAHDVLMHFPLNSTDRTMNLTPWFHRGGLHSGGLTPTLYCGGEVVILREFNPRKCLELAHKKEITFMIGVPSIIALLARAQEHSPVDLKSLRGIVTMGSPFEKSACDYYQKLFTPNIFNGYGTTETFWNTFLRPYNLPDKAGSAGQACTDDEVRIVRITNRDQRPDPDNLVAKDNTEVGEVIIRSPAKTCFGYVKNEQKSREKFYKGFHYTGDLGTWDENEFVTIVSRKDDMIISSGENIYPAQIEAILMENPKIAECAVVGKPDKRHGEIVVAYVVPRDESLTIEELKNFCASHAMLPSFKRPRIFNLVPELPHTATGKILHRKLRAESDNL